MIVPIKLAYNKHNHSKRSCYKLFFRITFLLPTFYIFMDKEVMIRTLFQKDAFCYSKWSPKKESMTCGITIPIIITFTIPIFLIPEPKTPVSWYFMFSAITSYDFVIWLFGCAMKSSKILKSHNWIFFYFRIFQIHISSPYIHSFPFLSFNTW